MAGNRVNLPPDLWRINVRWLEAKTPQQADAVLKEADGQQLGKLLRHYLGLMEYYNQTPTFNQCQSRACRIIAESFRCEISRRRLSAKSDDVATLLQEASSPSAPKPLPQASGKRGAKKGKRSAL